MIAIEIPKTTYSTLAYAKLMSVEMPFADAHRGAPYGQKNGPAIGLVGAGLAIKGGLVAKGFLGGLMIAGGVLSGLGAITGNKTLATIGGIASLAGGLGTAFSSAETFTNSVTGEVIEKGSFFNPFKAGQSFGNTQMGSMFSDIGKKLGISGDSIVTDAAGNALVDNTLPVDGMGSMSSKPAPIAGSLESDMGGLQNINGVAADQTAAALSGGARSSGLLSTLNDNRGVMDLASGLATGYNDMQRLEQQQPLIDSQGGLLDARTDTERFSLERARQQQQNMQAQNAPIATVNQGASIFTSAPTQQPKIAVNIGGAVRYVTQSEYDAHRAQQQPSGGLLQQGVTP